MLELKTKTFKVPISVDPDAQKSFRDPLIYYLAHRSDERPFFFTFVICDFFRQELIYIVSYYADNVALFEDCENKDIYYIKNIDRNPHCSIRIGQEKVFLTFFERARFFVQVNFETNMMRIYSKEDIGLDRDDEVIEFGATFYKDENNPDYFYFTALVRSEKYSGQKLRFFKSRLDLSEIKEIYAMMTNSYNAPHATRKVGRYLINSKFLNWQVKNNRSSQIFDSDGYARYVYEDLYREYCSLKGKSFSAKFFKSAEAMEDIMTNPGFHFFCHSKGENFLDICQKERYAFTVEKGMVTYLNMDNGKFDYFETTHCSPAHFEVDRVSGDLFVSSHNFIIFLGRIYFFGPAAIDRFSLSDGGLKKIATFSNPIIYRMTSHKVFSYQGKTYVCSFGQPNRLVFFNAETMEMLYYQDIEKNVPIDPAELFNFVNNDTGATNIRNIEVSNDGKFIFFLNKKFIHIYSFPERKIIQKISYFADISFGRDCKLQQFYLRTTHVNYLV